MRKADSPRGLLNQELETVVWSQYDTLSVLRSVENGGQKIVKKKMVLAMVLALSLFTTCALAAALLFSPRYDALQLADQALLNKYGITEEMQPGLIHTIKETDGATIVTYDVLESEVMRENRFGTYTVTVRDGCANAVWSMDGLSVVGGLDAPAWGAEQLRMYVLDYHTVMTYMETRGMLMNVPFDEALFWQREEKLAQDKQEALSLAKITLEDAAAIGREAIAFRYGLDEQQAAMMVRYIGEEDQSTYEMMEGRPLVKLFFHLAQKPGEWQVKDGVYVVTINLLDGAVEDIFYDTGLMGNG